MSQPDVEAGPRPGADRSSGTALQCTDWRAFAGPGPRWGRSIEQMEAEAEQRVAAAIERTVRGETFADVAPAWLEFLRHNLPVAAFAFNQCGHALTQMSRQSPSGPISDGLALQASMQQRQAQSLVLYTVDIRERIGELPMRTARDRWASDGSWLPAHHYLEQATTCPDWGEALVAINLCFEPLVGQLLRRELAIGRGPAHGDEVTPVVAEAGQREWELTREWTVAALHFVLADTMAGNANRALLRRWVARQAPPAIRAAEALAGLAGQLPQAGPEGEAVARVVADHRALLCDLGLEDR